MNMNVMGKTVLCLAMTTALFLAGCGSKTGGKSSDGKTGKSEDAHAEKGTHGGSLIELGEEEYHAEFLLDEASDTVTIYILDSTAKKNVPIEAKEIVINLTHGGTPEQYKLAANPAEGDEAGKSSRFVLKDGDLTHAVHEKGTNPQLSVTIAGKPYTGKITHQHEDGEKTHKH